MASLRLGYYSRLIRSNLHHRLSSNNHRRPSLSLIQSQPSIRCHLLNIPTSSTMTNTPTIRFLSTLRRPSGRVDIGARARQIQRRRLYTYALSFSCVAGFIVVVLATFQDQLVFYVTPTDALHKLSQDPSKTRFRLGGLVLEGSLSHPSSSKEIEFVVTDLLTDLLVRYDGMLPDLFREGHSVVVDGHLIPFPNSNEKSEDDSANSIRSASAAVSQKARSGSCYFAATEVLAKHDEKYMPKEVADAIQKNKALIDSGAVKDEERQTALK